MSSKIWIDFLMDPKVKKLSVGARVLFLHLVCAMDEHGVIYPLKETIKKMRCKFCDYVELRGNGFVADYDDDGCVIHNYKSFIVPDEELEEDEEAVI